MALDQKQDRFFYGGMNSDDMLETVPVGDYLTAVNITNDTKYETNKLGKIVARKGNEEIHNPFLVNVIDYNGDRLPLIERKTIGSVKDETNNKLYYFLYEHYGFAGVAFREFYSCYEFNNDKKTIEHQVFWTRLKVFDETLTIKFGSVLYGNLFWVQKGSEPKSINIIKAINFTLGTGTPAYVEMNMQEFNSVKRPPIAPIRAIYNTDTDRIDNNLRGLLFQFRHKYVYNDNTESVWSTISTCPKPSVDILPNGTYDDSDNNNVINLSWELNNFEIKETHIAIRYYDADIKVPSAWTLVYKADSNTTNYNFYNDIIGDVLASNETDKLIDYVPLSANAMEIISNPDKIVYAGDLLEANQRANIVPEVTLEVVRSTVNQIDDVSNGDETVYFDPTNIRTSLHPFWIDRNGLKKDLYFNVKGAWTSIYIPENFTADNVSFQVKYTPLNSTTPFVQTISLGAVSGTIAAMKTSIKNAINDFYHLTELGVDIAFDTTNTFEAAAVDGADFYTATSRDRWKYVDWAFTMQSGIFQGFNVDGYDYTGLGRCVFVNTGRLLDVTTLATFDDVIVRGDQITSNEDLIRGVGDNLGRTILQPNINSFIYVNDTFYFSIPYSNLVSDSIRFKKVTETSQFLTNKGIFSSLLTATDIGTTTVEDNTSLAVRETLTPFGEYGVGIVYYDEALRPCYVQYCDDIFIDRLDSEFDEAVIYKIKMNISHFAPDWAAYWQPVLTENKRTNTFFEIDLGILGAVANYITISGEHIKVKVNDAIALWHTTYPDTVDMLPEYSFEKGDRIVYFNATTNKYENREIVSEDATDIFVSKPTTVTADTDIANIIRIYKPRQTTLTERYFEVGEINTVRQPFGRHEYNINNTVGVQTYPLTAPLEYVIQAGDVYVNAINNYRVLTSTAPTWQPTYNKFYRVFYPSILNNYGRVHIENKLVETNPIQDRLRFSYASIDTSFVKGWNKFDFEDYTDMGGGYGSIVGLAMMGYTLKVLTELKLISIYVNRTVPVNVDGSESLILSDRTIGGISVPQYNYGCKHPDSLISNGRNLYYINSDNGFIIRDSANGQFPINTYKYNAYFQELSEQVRKDIALNKEYRIFAGFIKDNDEYVLIVNNGKSGFELPISNDLNGVVFNEKLTRWTNHITFKNNANLSPEWSDFVNHTCVTFLNGIVWLENSDTAPEANFYGRQYIPEIDTVINIEPKKVKTYQAIAVHSTDKWDMPTTDDIQIPANANYPQGMSSRLKANKLRAKEGIYYSEFLRDGNTPDMTYIEGLIKGRVLRGNILKLKLRNSAVNGDLPSELFSISVRVKLSEHSY